jgi:hypothetical protein
MPARRLWLGILFVSVVLIAPAGVAADTLIRQVAHTDAFEIMGRSQPASDDTVAIWLGGQRAAITGGKMNAVFDFTAKKFYIIDHAARSYSELPIPLDLKSLLPADDPNAANFQQMITMLKPTVKVTPTEQRKRIGQWNTQLYQIQITNSFMTINTDSWTTEDAKVDASAYAAMQGAILSIDPVTAEAASEMAKVKGVSIYEATTMTAMGGEMKMTRSTIDLGDKPAPAGTYAPPAGYALKPFNPLAGMKQ